MYNVEVFETPTNCVKTANISGNEFTVFNFAMNNVINGAIVIAENDETKKLVVYTQTNIYRMNAYDSNVVRENKELYLSIMFELVRNIIISHERVNKFFGRKFWW